MKMVDWIVKYWIEVVFGLIVAGLGIAYKRLAVKIKDTKAKDDAIAEGVKYLLMLQLREKGEQYLRDGYCSTEQKHEYEKAYSAYHALGGNDTITALKESVLKLPC